MGKIIGRVTGAPGIVVGVRNGANFDCTVTTYQGTPISGITVTLKVNGSTAGTGTSDVNGQCSIAHGVTYPITSSTTFALEASIPYLATNSYVDNPVFTAVTFPGTFIARKTSGGIFSAEAAGTLSRTGNAISGISLTNTGAGYEPGSWNAVTTSTGGGSGFRGEIQANSSGQLDASTFTVTGIGTDGQALSGGTGYTSNPTSIIVTRRITKMLFAVRMRRVAGSTNGQPLFNSSSSIINFLWSFTGTFRFRPILAKTESYSGDASGNQYVMTTSQDTSNSVLQTHIIAVDMNLASGSGGSRAYIDDTSVGATPSTYNQAGLAANTQGKINMSAAAMPAIALAGTIAATPSWQGVVEFIYLAFGYHAIDSVGGTTVPDISQQSVRNRFLPANISMADGTGPTGRAPNIFMWGPASVWNAGTNRGIGGNLSTIAGSVT